MNTSAHDSRDGRVSSAAQALFEREQLPFPPVPARLAALLQQQGEAWFATRSLESSPYDLDHFLVEIEANPDVPEYAVVGFDGYGTNSWGAHYYLVGKAIALFIQLPWGGAYLEPEPARQEIVAMTAWADALQAKLQLVDERRKIPDGWRLEAVASRFGHAGWRWLPPGQDNAETPWNPAAGMRAATLQELDDVLSGRRVLQA